MAGCFDPHASHAYASSPVIVSGAVRWARQENREGGAAGGEAEGADLRPVAAARGAADRAAGCFLPLVEGVELEEGGAAPEVVTVPPPPPPAPPLTPVACPAIVCAERGRPGPLLPGELVDAVVEGEAGGAGGLMAALTPLPPPRLVLLLLLLMVMAVAVVIGGAGIRGGRLVKDRPRLLLVDISAAERGEATAVEGVAIPVLMPRTIPAVVAGAALAAAAGLPRFPGVGATAEGRPADPTAAAPLVLETAAPAAEPDDGDAAGGRSTDRQK